MVELVGGPEAGKLFVVGGLARMAEGLLLMPRRTRGGALATTRRFLDTGVR
jgi:hypothetical protein